MGKCFFLVKKFFLIITYFFFVRGRVFSPALPLGKGTRTNTERRRTVRLVPRGRPWRTCVPRLLCVSPAQMGCSERLRRRCSLPLRDPLQPRSTDEPRASVAAGLFPLPFQKAVHCSTSGCLIFLYRGPFFLCVCVPPARVEHRPARGWSCPSTSLGGVGRPPADLKEKAQKIEKLITMSSGSPSTVLEPATAHWAQSR